MKIIGLGQWVSSSRGLSSNTAGTGLPPLPANCFLGASPVWQELLGLSSARLTRAGDRRACLREDRRWWWLPRVLGEQAAGSVHL